MSIEEARRILGHEYDALSDGQIQKMLDLFTQLSIILIDNKDEIIPKSNPT